MSPKGVEVHRRVHDFELRRVGSEVEVRFIYAMHIDPGTLTGGEVRLTLRLVERLGLANTVVQKNIKHKLRIASSKPSEREIAADFYGYRFYRRLAQRRSKALAKNGVRLSMKDQDRLPPLDRAPPKVAAQVLQFDRERRLFWVAHRHLIAAMRHPDPATQKLAQAYLRNLEKPRRQWQGVPSIGLVDRSSPPPASPRTGISDGAVTRLEPDSEQPINTPAPRRRSRPGPNQPQRLEPSTEYELGTERIPPPPPPPAPPPAPAPPPPPPKLETVDEDPDAVIYEDDPFGERSLRRFTRIPSYYRSLVLEDPNIGFGGAVRAAIASVETRESADTVAIFYSAQAAITRDLGLELTIPTQYLDITSFPGDRNPPAQYEIGNPLVAVKYRFQLPKVQGRHPAFVLKARWGIPFSRLHRVPATGLIVEDFTREVNFADTYAFFLENHDIGLGGNFVWQWRWLYTGVQLFGDLFIPVGSASQDTVFSAISYGATVGALPFGDLVGFFVEGRGTSLLLGGGRNEFFTYLGARGRFLDMIEPAIWIGIPVGSIQDASPVQFGVELRFAYDLDAILEPRRARREQDILE